MRVIRCFNCFSPVIAPLNHSDTARYTYYFQDPKIASWDPSEPCSACSPCEFPLGRVSRRVRLTCWRACLRSRTTSVIVYLTRRATARRGGAQFGSIGHRAAMRLAIFARPRRRTWTRSPIATRLFDVHLSFSRTSVGIDLTRRATAPGDGAHQLDSIDITAILARRRRCTRARSLTATRSFGVHLGFSRTSVVIDLTVNSA